MEKCYFFTIAQVIYPLKQWFDKDIKPPQGLSLGEVLHDYLILITTALRRFFGKSEDLDCEFYLPLKWLLV